MAIPPYMSDRILDYYEKTGQTELADLQRQSNENVRQVLDAYDSKPQVEMIAKEFLQKEEITQNTPASASFTCFPLSQAAVKLKEFAETLKAVFAAFFKLISCIL